VNTVIGKDDSNNSMILGMPPRMTSLPHMTFETSGSSGDADVDSTTELLPSKRARRCSDHSHTSGGGAADCTYCGGSGDEKDMNGTNGRPRSTDTHTTQDKEDAEESSEVTDLTCPSPVIYYAQLSSVTPVLLIQ
jgi:hypothetical protein